LVRDYDICNAYDDCNKLQATVTYTLIYTKRGDTKSISRKIICTRSENVTKQ